jgi:Protein of unknown function (DUF2752)
MIASRQQAGWWAALAVLPAAAGVWALRSFDPNVAGNPFPPCLFHAVTGLWCPGCGLTRCAHALVHFDLARAFEMNALAMVAAPVLALLAARSAGWLPPSLSERLRPLTSLTFWFALVAAFAVLRNLPWPPFSWLAPGGWTG